MKFYLITWSLMLSFTTNAQLALGDQLPTLTLKALDGQEVVVAPPHNKYVVIDFWASWCAPCRKQNKLWAQWEKDTTHTDLVLMGIALDTDAQQWRNAIAKDGLGGQQFNDPHGFEAATALRFGVEQLPAAYLFDKTGRLIAINPTLQELRNLINSK